MPTQDAVIRVRLDLGEAQRQMQAEARRERVGAAGAAAGGGPGERVGRRVLSNHARLMDAQSSPLEALGPTAMDMVGARGALSAATGLANKASTMASGAAALEAGGAAGAAVKAGLVALVAKLVVDQLANSPAYLEALKKMFPALDGKIMDGIQATMKTFAASVDAVKNGLLNLVGATTQTMDLGRATMRLGGSVVPGDAGGVWGFLHKQGMYRDQLHDRVERAIDVEVYGKFAEGVRKSFSR